MYLDHLTREFDAIFGRPLPPDPVDALEASDGICALRPAPLQHLSLVRCARGRDGVPHVPDNIQRRRAFRDLLPVEIHNDIPWQWHNNPKRSAS